MPETVVIQNPRSGTGEHTDAVRSRVESLGYAIEQTDKAGDTIFLAQDAAERGVTTIVAAGGDGTVNEVVRGIDRADAFDDVTLGVLPLGTGNSFAEQIGCGDLDTAFSVLQDGDRRRIDLGAANERPFVNSCVAGLTADSSSETSSAMKERLGVLAYVITTLRSVSEFESPTLTIDSETVTGSADWAGEALGVLVGNGRRFTTEGSGQANMEDGMFDVAVIKDVSALDLMGDAVVERLFGRNSPHITRYQSRSLTITVHDQETIRFSLDGEIIQQGQLALHVRPRTLTVRVGDAYDPDPD